MDFNIPNDFNEHRINYSEIVISLPTPYLIDTSFVLEVFSTTSPWSEDNLGWDYPWDNLGGDIDSISTFRRFFIVNDIISEINFDITALTIDWINEIKENNGVLIVIKFLNGEALNLNINRYIHYIRSNLYLKVNFTPN